MPQVAKRTEALLERASICQGVAAASREKLAAASHFETFAAGQSIWRRNQAAEFILLIETGHVMLTQATPTGKPVVVELLGTGDCMGLLATLGRVPHPFSARALTDVSALHIRSAEWREAALSDPDLLRRATEAVVPRMLGGFGFMATMATGRVEERLALALLRLDELNSRENGPGQPIAITRQTLASIGVTTVESAIRVTSRWNKAGILWTGHRTLRVVDRSALESLAVGLQSGDTLTV